MSTGSELQIKATRLFESGKYDQAAEAFTEAISAFEAEDNNQLANEMRVNLGLARREAGDYEGAVTDMQAGLAYFRESGDRLREAQTLGNMALVYAKLDDNEQAQTMYREAAAIFKELEEDDYYGETILALGDLQFRSGDLIAALGTFEVGLDYVRNKNHRQKIMKQLLVLKNRMTGMGRVQEGDDEDSTPPASDSRRRRRRRGLFGRQKKETEDTTE